MKKEEIKQFYEKYHKDEIINPVADFMQEERCNYLRFLLKNIYGKILVIGCGSQDEMDIINERCEGIGIDISEKAVEKSKAKYSRFEYFVADATNLPFSENSFDCVVCSEVIEHIPENEKVFSEVRRVLKNKGTFIVTTPNWLSWYGLVRKIAEKLFNRPFTAGDQPIDNWSTPFSLRKKLEKYGFKIMLYRGLWYYPPTGKGRKRIPHKIIFPVIRLFYPFEILFRKMLPWFGHMILFKTCLMKSDDRFDYRYWKDRHKQEYGFLSSVGQRTYSNRANFYIYKLVKEQYRKVIKRINLPIGSKILDAGCGTGIFTEFLLSKGFVVDAVDISPNALIYLKKKNPTVKTICKPLSLLSDDKQYDVVHCFDVLYHILDDKEFELTLTKFSKLAKKYIILHERFLNKKPLIISKHIKFRPYNQLKMNLKKLGFEEYMSLPTHFITSQLFTYKITKFFPRFFYIFDKKVLNTLEKVSINLADKFGSHHIKVFRRTK